MSSNDKRGLWLLVAGFAVLSSLPFLVSHTGVLMLLAFVPLFFLNDFLRRENIKHPFLFYYTAFLLFNAATTFWVGFATVAGAVAAIMLNALQMAAIFALYRWASKVFARLCSKRPWESDVCSLIFFIITWCAWEHVYYEVEITWPWLALGNAFASSPELVQWYDTVGTTGGTMWILLCNAAVFLALKAENKRQRSRRAVAAALLIAVPACISIAKYCTYEESSDPLEIVVAQPNIDPYDKFGVMPQTEIDRKLLGMFESKMTPQTELLITPETFTYNIDIDNPSNNLSFLTYLDFLDNHPDTKMLLGALTVRNYTASLKPTESARKGAGDRMWYDVFNTAMVFDHSRMYGYYFKSKLVPGVERIPYEKYLKPIIAPIFEKFGGGGTSYGTQSEMEPIEMGEGRKIAGLICYESVFGDYCSIAAKKGAGLFAVITNDGWWGNTPGHVQHLEFARLRAIECRRDVIFAANTGCSAVINQRGDILLKTPYWEEDVFNATVNMNDCLTAFSKHGDKVGRYSAHAFWGLLFTVLFLNLAFVQDKKSSRGKSA